MREILFRGQRVGNGEWVEGYYVKCRRRHYILELYNEFGYDERWETSMWVEVIPETVGQYTGLRDKNGTKIFEGDILTAHDDDPLTFVVTWYEIHAAFNIMGINTAAFIIIGNIHDNPELVG